ncbi:MAG: 3,4-dehydroadipyl-CoA semialdehyde dehydrogenase [Myxococcales bacterium]|nr:3,4-dehydroadipyl-CoA semialdehyde dehydrogenase [Polyangiaceae bacterium]MDW8249085.1 3,4-dehydroadipyl-CoA semialdehyde dehydrogenase [Myxococcales bacterium]
METLRSYLSGSWYEASSGFEELVNPTTEEILARASAEGADLAHALHFARNRSGPALRAMTFAQRAEMLKGLAKAIHASREELLDLGVRNGGNTRSDAKFDVDGASSTLAAYADLGASLGDGRFLVDGDPIPMGRSSRLAGQHVLVPRRGVAVLINAFNFPAWGLAEKAACAWLAGVPVLVKPATPTALLTVRLVEKLLATNLLPEGALQLLVGAPGDLLCHLGPQDVVSFTGSSRTGTLIRTHPQLAARSVRVNVEADSLNASILGPDVEPGSEVYAAFLADIVRDVTQKAGQKCTAIRRIFVPIERLDSVREELVERLAAIRVGDPCRDTVQMGPVATAAQLRSVREGIRTLLASERVEIATGGPDRPSVLEGVEGDRGFFVAPTLLVARDAVAARPVHEHEVFGPCTTLMPYDGTAQQAASLVALGEGGLVASIATNDRDFARDLILELAPFHGRVYLNSEKSVGVAPGPGTVFPQLLHGGPGRAGGGEELGGLRGLTGYMQRVALQGFGPLIDAIAAGGKRGG